MLFTHVQELFGTVVLKQVTRPLRWSNMATMPTLPETQAGIKEEIRRQVCTWPRLDPVPLLTLPACFCAGHREELWSGGDELLPLPLDAEVLVHTQFCAALGVQSRALCKPYTPPFEAHFQLVLVHTM